MKSEKTVINQYLSEIGRRGGKARSKNLTATGRTKAARYAANKRWHRRRG